MLQPFPGAARSFVYIKTSLLLRLKAETRWSGKETRMRKFVREKKLHQDSSAKASGLAHCRVLEEPETRRGGEETGDAWKKAWSGGGEAFMKAGGKRSRPRGGQTGELWARKDRSHTSNTGHQSLAVPQWGANACETHQCSVPVCSKATLHRGQMLASLPWGVCRRCQGEESRAPRGPFSRK